MDITTILVEGEDHAEFDVTKQVFEYFQPKLEAHCTFDFNTLSRNIWALQYSTMQRRLAQIHANMDISPEMFHQMIDSISIGVKKIVVLAFQQY